ncbi:hypothetical protein RCL_jg10156.t1 [Rhizophagus clarus]|uniref:Uncharacterized protein n=1 Tax=Rhizophagus clarus TaxID=94130 RepID=A0A8H3KWA4_9GLOM|nr:hypothetical protein RCL_jg10156.t1 [Rhizophagus clarus]
MLNHMRCFYSTSTIILLITIIWILLLFVSLSIDFGWSTSITSALYRTTFCEWMGRKELKPPIITKNILKESKLGDA